MRTADFDYRLPEDQIAQHPAPRGTSRLLVMDAAAADRHRSIADLPQLLRRGDLVIANDTRVIPARLFARRRPTGGRVEILLVERLEPGEWKCLLKPGRRLRIGQQLELEPGLVAAVVDRADGGTFRLRFSQPIGPHLERLGHVPLPPYIQRPDDGADRQLYQTVFAAHPGAIAAPTAGLHFNGALLERLATAGVATALITLHVGIGTFKPVAAERIADHSMESERYSVPEATAAAIERTRQAGGRIVAIGTTVVRTLEAATGTGGGSIQPGSGATSLFITPGFRFRAVDVLLTNFHLPRSTLLMLVSAFAGREKVLAAYRTAIEHGYRFYSYGDAMLAERR